MHACCLYLVLSFFFPFIVLFFSVIVSSEEVKKISYQYRYPLKGICFLYQPKNVCKMEWRIAL